MPTFTVKSNLHHDGKAYAAGKTVKIDDDEQAQALLDVGAIEAPKAEKQSAPPKDEKPPAPPRK